MEFRIIGASVFFPLIIDSIVLSKFLLFFCPPTFFPKPLVNNSIQQNEEIALLRKNRHFFGFFIILVIVRFYFDTSTRSAKSLEIRGAKKSRKLAWKTLIKMEKSRHLSERVCAHAKHASTLEVCEQMFHICSLKEHT